MAISHSISRAMNIIKVCRGDTPPLKPPNSGPIFMHAVESVHSMELSTITV